MRQKPRLLLLVVAVLTLLLPILAYLQYDWLGKVSEREHEQMQAGLRRTLAQFRQDFDREIARIYFQFQVAPNATEHPGEEFAKLQAHWNSTAPYPGLIKNIFLDRVEPGGLQRLQRLNLSTSVWEPADSTAEFGPHRPFGQLNGSIPAVVIPIMRFGRFLPAERIVAPERLAQVIVRLDLDYIKTKFVPALLQTHFGDIASEYRVQITDREDKSQLIYSSSGDSTSSIDDAGDAVQNVFELRIPDYHNLMPTTVPFTREIVSAPARQLHTFDVQVFRGIAMSPAAGTMELEIDPGLWRVSATHRSGSLATAVGQVRRRNLAVSFGILALLAVSIAIVLISAERAQRLARQQMEFVSAVSHELRTPLAVICSAGENLADGVVRDPGQLRSYGKVVRNEGRRLTEMVEQVLSFAGIQSGLKKYALVPTQVAPVVERALGAFEMLLREGGFLVERRVAENLPQIRGDASALCRALQNLVSNAIKYGGTNHWIGVSAYKTDDCIKIAVQDRGAGIPCADLPHIFDPFYRGRSAVEGQVQGSGLGLSLVKEIVNAHGGTIEVTCEPAGGSTFCITLPIPVFHEKARPFG